MRQGAIRSRFFAGLAVVTLALAGSNVAVANPVPPGYQDFPVAPGEFVAQVPRPLIVDDFEPGLSGRIAFVEWWGSFSDGPWAITLYSNADPDPSAPDDGGASIVTTAFLFEPWNGDIFHYAADMSSAGWRMEEGSSYWLGVASFGPGWTWALGDGQPVFGAQRQNAVGLLDDDSWATLTPPSHLAFGVWPTLAPEPGTLGLVAVGLLGLGLGRRRGAGVGAWGRTLKYYSMS